jgi:hypothetical protein
LRVGGPQKQLAFERQAAVLHFQLAREQRFPRPAGEFELREVLHRARALRRAGDRPLVLHDHDVRMRLDPRVGDSLAVLVHLRDGEDDSVVLLVVLAEGVVDIELLEQLAEGMLKRAQLRRGQRGRLGPVARIGRVAGEVGGGVAGEQDDGIGFVVVLETKPAKAGSDWSR